MFVVQSGEVDIILNGKVVETVGPEGFFGEISLIEDSARAADAIAKTDCTLLPVNRHHFLFMVDEMPQFALHVMKGMADRLRRADQRAAV
jgi:CRP-like cAMP-binding protein